MHIIVDGYNMIRQSDALKRAEKQSLETGRHALIRLVSLYKTKKGHKLTVVFDGWVNGSPAEEREFSSGIDIIYSKLGEKADDVIKRIARTSGEEVVVVTSDRDIRASVERKEGVVISPREFEARIKAAQDGWNAFMGRKDDENNESPVGLSKRGPAKRLSRKQKNDQARLKKL
ncbi:MAG: NYN domain-containing protein [Deltaproteobacteria bacterium]|nr:NYN domain-containing protein [Deltaproteobacteria bacterium]